MQSNTGLGNLFRLPSEIRLRIWDYLSLHPIQCEVTDPASLKQPRLAFLQTSYRIHDEVSKHLYKDLVLRFQVSPNYKYRSWLTVESNAGARWHLQDLDDAVSQGFGKLPYEKLKRIQIEIDAPCRRDPGQIVCLWKKCFDLSRLLEQAKRGLPNLEIHFKDSTSTKWSVDGEPQKSVAVDRKKNYPPQDSVIDRTNEQSVIDDEDYFIILKVFFHLRNARTAKVYLPEDMVRYNEWAKAVEPLLEQKKPFGTRLDADDPWNDEELQEDQDCLFMELDVELDLLPGITANMMRLERFSSWYVDGLGSESRYERELERILKTWSNSMPNFNEAVHIYRRYAAMRAFNPRSLFYRYSDSLSWDMTSGVYSFAYISKIKEEIDLGLIKEEWNRDTWHDGCYPSGIPEFDSTPFLWELCRSGCNSISIKYKDDFYVL